MNHHKERKKVQCIINEQVGHNNAVTVTVDSVVDDTIYVNLTCHVTRSDYMSRLDLSDLNGVEAFDGIRLRDGTLRFDMTDL